MACWVESDAGSLPPFRPDAQHNLLAHGSAGHEDGCLFPQYLSNFLFKLGNDFPFAVVVCLLVRVSYLGQVCEDLARELVVVSNEEAGAAALDTILIAAVDKINSFRI